MCPNLFMFQTYAADIFFGQSWDDHRLKLPANMTSEYRLLPVEWLGRRHSVQLTVQIMNLWDWYLSKTFRKLFTISIEERRPKIGFSSVKVPTFSEYFKNQCQWFDIHFEQSLKDGIPWHLDSLVSWWMPAASLSSARCFASLPRLNAEGSHCDR